MPGKYAEGTNVTPLQTLEEIKRTLVRFGADRFGYYEDLESTVVTFQVDNLRVALKMEHPSRQPFEKNSYGNPRKAHVVDADHEQAIRSRWRVLHLAIKAKLALVEEGISTVEREFLSDVVLPNGVSVEEYMRPVLAESRRMALGSGEG